MISTKTTNTYEWEDTLLSAINGDATAYVAIQNQLPSIASDKDARECTARLITLHTRNKIVAENTGEDGVEAELANPETMYAQSLLKELCVAYAKRVPSLCKFRKNGHNPRGIEDMDFERIVEKSAIKAFISYDPDIRDSFFPLANTCMRNQLIDAQRTANRRPDTFHINGEFSPSYKPSASGPPLSEEELHELVNRLVDRSNLKTPWHRDLARLMLTNAIEGERMTGKELGAVLNRNHITVHSVISKIKKEIGPLLARELFGEEPPQMSR